MRELNKKEIKEIQIGILKAIAKFCDENVALLIICGFIFSSVAFEPDFGSWVRHESVVFPLFIVIMDLHSKVSRNNTTSLPLITNEEKVI